MFETNNTSATMTLQGAVQRYFDVALYLLVLSGFGALASTGSLDLPTVALVGLVLFVRGYLLAKNRTVIIPERWTAYLTIGYVAFYIADYFLVSGNFIATTIRLVLFVMLVRLFSLQRDRDHYALAILAFLMVLAAAVLTVDSIFLLSFAFFVLIAIGTFMLMEMRHSANAEVAHAREREATAQHRRMGFALVGISPLILTVVLVGAAAIFFALPRVSSRYLSSYATTSELLTGFSDHVQLGTIGQIQQSTSVVMRVRIDGDTTGRHDLKWRGVSLSLFDGRVWSNPFEPVVLARSPNSTFLLDVAWSQKNRRSPGALIRYHVMMEPIGTNIFFLAPRAKTLAGTYRTVAADAGGAVFNLDGEHPVTMYEAESDATPSSRDLSGLSPAGSPISPAMPYLQLPAVDIRISKLAEQITSGEATVLGKAKAMERYLQNNFTYTLELPRSVPRDPLTNFLFERKQGHCEYFASSMAVMLRTIGIPSRVVNGFRTSEFNDLTGNYVVRASSAHSWVEAYIPEQGWVDFDPTPAAEPAASTNWNRFLQYVDAASSFWREWVINYDATHQAALGQGAARNSRALFSNLHDWSSSQYSKLLSSARRLRRDAATMPYRWAGAGLLLTAFLLVLLNMARIVAFIRARFLYASPERAPQEVAALWYLRMTRRLAKRGWTKRPSDTPVAFVLQITDRKLRQSVDGFTRAYESARFGTSLEDARALSRLYEEIEANLQNACEPMVRR